MATAVITASIPENIPSKMIAMEPESRPQATPPAATATVVRSETRSAVVSAASGLAAIPSRLIEQPPQRRNAASLHLWDRCSNGVFEKSFSVLTRVDAGEFFHDVI